MVRPPHVFVGAVHKAADARTEANAFSQTFDVTMGLDEEVTLVATLGGSATALTALYLQGRPGAGDTWHILNPLTEPDELSFATIGAGGIAFTSRIQVYPQMRILWLGLAGDELNAWLMF